MDPTASSVALGALISIIGALIGWYLKSIKADAAQAHEGIGQRIGGLDKRIDGLQAEVADHCRQGAGANRRPPRPLRPGCAGCHLWAGLTQ